MNKSLRNLTPFRQHVLLNFLSNFFPSISSISQHLYSRPIRKVLEKYGCAARGIKRGSFVNLFVRFRDKDQEEEKETNYDRLFSFTVKMQNDVSFTRRARWPALRELSQIFIFIFIFIFHCRYFHLRYYPGD